MCMCLNFERCLSLHIQQKKKGNLINLNVFISLNNQNRGSKSSKKLK